MSVTSAAEATMERVNNEIEQRLKQYALIPVEDRDMSLSIYKQACLFEALHLPKHYMFTNRIVLSDDGKRYVMVKREKPLECMDFDLEDRHEVGGKIPTFSDRTGFNASIKNHEHDDVLFNAMHCSVEWQELQ